MSTLRGAAALSVCLLLTPALAQAQVTDAPAAPVAVDPAPPATVPAEPAPAPASEAPPAPETSAPATATAGAPVVPGIVEAPPAGKSQVVFFRTSKLVGAALSFTIREGDTEIAKVGNGRYFVAVVEPGAHAYAVKGEVTDVLNIEADEGETYFVEHTLGVGIVMGRPNLAPSDQAAFERVSAKLKPAKAPSAR